MSPWHPDQNDAAAFAAFRWYANQLESLAISLYVTDRNKFAQIAQAFKTAAASLNATRDLVQQCNSNSDCAPGYVCVNGQCEPDFLPPAQSPTV